jgi:hypothetical protein
LFKHTRKHEALALRGRPQGHRSAKNTTKLEMFVVGLLTNTRNTQGFWGDTDPPRGAEKGQLVAKRLKWSI